MRSISVALAAALLASLLAGCGILGGRGIRLAVTAEPLGLEAAYGDDASATVGALVHAGLYRIDASFTPQPLLAIAAPTISTGGTIWGVRLKDGLTFHDGSSLTASDVVFTYELAKSARCPLVAEICDLVRTRLESVKANADGTLTFTLVAPWSPWATRGLTIPILPKESINASLERLVAATAGADREAVSLERETIATALDPATCATGGPDACSYATRVAELEATLAAAGSPPPDPRIFPELSLTGEPTGRRDDEAYGRALFAQLSTLETMLLAPIDDRLVAAYSILDVQSAPIGAGPFSFAERVPGDFISLRPFAGFAGGAPKASGATVRRFVSNAGAVTAFQSGQLDWVPGLRAGDVAGLKVRDDGELLSPPSLRGYYYLAFNVRSGRLFADVALRRALASCVDISALIADATDATGIPVSSTVAASSWAAEASPPVESTLDVPGGRATIEAAGWLVGSDGVYSKAGRRLEAEILVRDGQTLRVRAAQAIADQAAKCGMSLTVSPQPYSTGVLPALRFPSDFDLYLGGWQWSIDPDDSDILSSDACPTTEAPAGKNFGCWQNPDADALLKRGLTTTGLSARATIYAAFQELRRQERPYLLLWSDPGYALIARQIDWPTRVGDVASPLYDWSVERWDRQGR
ncbi:MAG: ABC transporter substrate-binding protein [Candidatus Limnocylindrus sp.]